MRALLVAIESLGDTLPFIGLGRQLRAQGHEATLIGGGVYRQLAEREQLDFVEILSTEEHQRRIRQRDGWNVFAAVDEGCRNLLDAMPRTYAAIADRYVANETVVVAQGLMFGARIAQEKLGVPLATVHLQPGLFRQREPKPLWPRNVRRALRALGYRAMDSVADWHLAASINDFRRSLGLAPVQRILDRWWNSPQLTIGFFPQFLAPACADSPTIFPGFPLYHGAAEFEQEDELARFLSAGEPPLVFSPTSLMGASRDFLQCSAEVAVELGRRAILLTPHAERLPPGLPDEIRHFAFVPHSRLLPHAAAIIHNGGIGTVAAALSANLPQLIVPRVLDQPDNAKRLQSLGVADVIKPKGYRKNRVASALDRLIASPEVAEQCRKIAALCRADQALERAVEALERLCGSAGCPKKSHPDRASHA
jgi:UDP:flavonoid glycosyltransferase YjiC (YdhE family)